MTIDSILTYIHGAMSNEMCAHCDPGTIDSAIDALLEARKMLWWLIEHPDTGDTLKAHLEKIVDRLENVKEADDATPAE